MQTMIYNRTLEGYLKYFSSNALPKLHLLISIIDWGGGGGNAVTPLIFNSDEFKLNMNKSGY